MRSSDERGKEKHKKVRLKISWKRGNREYDINARFLHFWKMNLLAPKRNANNSRSRDHHWQTFFPWPPLIFQHAYFPDLYDSWLGLVSQCTPTRTPTRTRPIGFGLFKSEHLRSHVKVCIKVQDEHFLQATFWHCYSCVRCILAQTRIFVYKE